MTDTVLIVLIIALAVIVVLLFFRNQLSRFLFKANREGIEAELQTHKPVPGATSSTATSGAGGVAIRGNKQVGEGNAIDVGRDNVVVEDNVQRGKDQKIQVRPDPSGKKPKR